MDKQKFGRRLAASAGSLAGLTAGPMLAEAGVIHVHGSPVSLNINAPNGSSVTWDIDGDSVGEFRLWNRNEIITWTTNGNPQFFAARAVYVASNTVAGGRGNGRGLVAPFSTDDVQALVRSEWVSASRVFGRDLNSPFNGQDGFYLYRNAMQTSAGQNVIGYDFDYGFRSDKINMVGFRFDAGQGDRFGYADFQWDLGSGTLSINEWWYDDSGSAVHVTPEPSALALLALGAAGIAAYRATRKSIPHQGSAGCTLVDP